MTDQPGQDRVWQLAVPAPARWGHRRRVACAIAAVTAAVVAILAVVVWVTRPTDYDYSQTKVGHALASENVDHSDVTGSVNDWLRPLCRSGTYREPAYGALTHATVSGQCQTPRGQTIYIGLYDESVAGPQGRARGTVPDVQMPFRPNAGGNRGGFVIKIALDPRVDVSPLQPLAQYGFVVIPRR
jgi:hypothetical protein